MEVHFEAYLRVLFHHYESSLSYIRVLNGLLAMLMVGTDVP